MMPNKGVTVPLFVFALLISLVIADPVQLNLAFFTDTTCTTRSTISPNATLGLSICAATLGALSVFVPTTPCSGNNVQLLAFSDTTCGSTSGSYFNNEGCYEWFSGSIGSILLTCQVQSNGLPGNIVSHTTISVGPLAADATNAPTANPTSVGFSPTGTASTGGTGGSTSSGSSGSSNSNSSNSSSTSSTGWDALPIGAKVGVIVGAIVAVAIIAFLGWCIWHRDRKHERMVAMSQGYNSNYNNSMAYPHGGQSVYQPSTYIPPTIPPSAQAMHSPPMSQPGYAPTRYPVTEVDWNEENNKSRYTGSELGASDIASWRDGTNTVTAPTHH